MGRTYTGIDVFDAAFGRLRDAYAGGNRIVVSFSGGKDSGITLELAILAATEAGRLPVEVVMRDEEIMLPGTFEYCERVAAREEVEFHWIYACQPITNAFARGNPYWWVFDPELEPEQWVRQPPDFAYFRYDARLIHNLISSEHFPADNGFDLIVLEGLRASESRNRMFGLFSSGGWMTKEQKGGYRIGRPIYDWGDGDVWKAVKDWSWDYNEAYDVMHRFGVNRRELRIAPPTMRAASISLLQVAAKAWPRWFDRVAARCSGVRTAAQYGRRACEPIRRHNETWEECFERTCVKDAPEWIAERAAKARDVALRRHAAHSTEPLPQAGLCPRCPVLSSWQQLANTLYMGDPFSFAAKDLPYMEPEYFRQGAGTWGGKPTW